MVLVSNATRQDCADATRRRREAANLYRPEPVRLLLIAQTPPADLDRYFYFPSVQRADYLFQAVVPHILGEEPTRINKRDQLAALLEQGVFMIDLKPDPCDSRPVEAFVEDLVPARDGARAQADNPRQG